ncbi:hypothetical protein HY933_03060 [Candidatus Falkowbacteria bacterium]|nr:hypothetical protein [Candidatus Falkowbacteria bacterium]
MGFSWLKELAQRPELLQFVFGPEDRTEGIPGVLMVRPETYDRDKHLINLLDEATVLLPAGIAECRRMGWLPFIHDRNPALVGALLRRLQSQYVNGNQISLTSKATKSDAGRDVIEWTVRYGFAKDAQRVSHDNLCLVLVAAFLDLLRRESDDLRQHAANLRGAAAAFENDDPATGMNLGLKAVRGPGSTS